MNLTGLPRSDNSNSNNGPANDTQSSRDKAFSAPYSDHVRYRENSLSSDNGAGLMNHLGISNNTPNENDIAKFCKESNYGYSFANSATQTPPINTRLQRLSSWTRRSSSERSLDCVRLIRSKLDGVDFGRRFSQPDMGAIDRQRSRYENMARRHIKQPQKQHQVEEDQQHVTRLSTNHAPDTTNHAQTSDPATTLLSTSDSELPGTSSYSSLPTSPIYWEYNAQHETTDSLKKNELGTIMENSIHRQPSTKDLDHGPVPPWVDKPISTVDSGSPSNSASTSTTATSSCASRYLRALHTPTRFLPQQQAILTTDADGNILLFNDISCLCFGIDKSYIGRSILTKFDAPSQHMMAHRLNERKKQLRRKSILLQRQESTDHGGMVLMCGVIIPIIRSSGKKSAASLWLKEKWNKDQGRFVYLWIFEEIYESRLTVTLDAEGAIQNPSSKALHDIYGYNRTELIGQPIRKLISSLDMDSNSAAAVVNKCEFYASRSKDGTYFPSMVQLHGSELQITLLPTISGLITIHQNGRVQSINPVPAKYLFGYKVKEVAQVMQIDTLLPQFTSLVSLLNQRQALRHDRIISCRDCLDMWRQQTTSSRAEDDHFTAVHRDGGRFAVDLQLRLVESDGESLYSVWISYNRRITRSSHPSPPPSIRTTTDGDNVTPPCGTTCGTLTRTEDRQAASHEEPRQQNLRTATTYPGRFESFGSVPKDKALFPQNDSSSTSVSSTTTVGPPSIVFPDFDDYVIIDSLGEGTYGSAKLVQSKSDPSQEFVIKAIVKSRIIIDSWVRDRKYGSLPIEIHILLKLQQNPHVNCPQLVTFMEDDDNYYTLTRLHGDGMDLFDYIELNDQMTEGQVRRIFHQVAAAIQHLHHLRIVHRDIKDENILLDDRGIVQLIDFGSAAYYREGRLFDTFSGTLDYCSPEILNGTSYAGPPQDMWSLGILLYTLIFRETPFYSVDDIMEHNLQLPFVPYPELAVGPMDLLYKLLNRDINQRPTIDQVMQDPWLEGES